MPDTEGSQVIVVGAGIAGLSAALRLAERDFKVTLVEQNNFLGGKLGAHKHEGSTLAVREDDKVIEAYLGVAESHEAIGVDA
jgi:uncharacterized protein with NAD-binding domain and iron-sulfur cluster